MAGLSSQPKIAIFRSFLVEFQRFRETGLLAFATSMRLFNHAFPGHYGNALRTKKTTLTPGGRLKEMS